MNDNDQYLYELNVAEMNRDFELKSIEILRRIDVLFLQDYHRRMNESIQRRRAKAAAD